MEAVYRHASKTVGLGAKGLYSSQISHHFCSRSVAVLSIRPTRNEGDYQLKVKYYLEGFPEPQILLFDLDRMRERAKAASEKLNWQESIVDLMKLLNMDSSLGARKKLAQQWGYTGALNGSADMNIWLHQQVLRRIREGGGRAPDGIPPDATPAPS
jgi:hypothetical protein